MTDDEIMEKLSNMSNVSAGVDFWYRELDRRSEAAAMERTERLTRATVILAAVAVMAAVVQIIVAIATA